MRRTLSGALLACVALPLLLASTVLAGGWASAVLDDNHIEPTAGQTVTIGFTLYQHAETRVSWPTASIVFTKGGSSEKLVFLAKAVGQEGHYVADVTLPSDGTWAMRIETTQLEVTTVLRPVAVKPATIAGGQAAPAAAQPAAQPPAAQPAPVAPAPISPAAPASSAPTTPILLLMALLIAGILGAGLIVGRRNGSLGRRGGTIPGR